MEQLIIVKTEEELTELLKYIDTQEIIAFDTESNGLDEDADIIGFSVSADPELAYYVILKFWDKEKQELVSTALDALGRYAMERLQSKQLIMHNAIFDCNLVNRNYKIDLMPAVSVDTLMLAHLLNENRSNGLKELSAAYFGADAKKEQAEMAASVAANGGIAKINAKSARIEMYKADPDLIAKYGAKDALLTYKLMVLLVDELSQNQDLWKFFFEDETMPLLKGPTYDLNSTGLKVDMVQLNQLDSDLDHELLRLESKIHYEIADYVKDLYPGDKPKNTFSITSNEKIAWLLFIRLGCEFGKLTERGRIVAKDLIGEIPYSMKKKKQFIAACKEKELKAEKFLKADKDELEPFRTKFSWVNDLLEYKRLGKLKTTYVEGIKKRAKYNVIRPGFLQHGTTSGRYSSQNPNFQNLPRDDKRVKSCIVPRPGKVFVGADYSQLEPRVFASFSQDEALLRCFERGEDFYSVIGMEVWDIKDASAFKDDENAFSKKYKSLRQKAKTFGLAATYGTTPYKMIESMKGADGEKLTIEECQQILNDYFLAFPGVKKFMDESHKIVVATGQTLSRFGRPRRIPDAKALQSFGNFKHERLPYEYRNYLNLSVNHRIQSTGASIINRSAISLRQEFTRYNLDAKLVLQVHDELVVECKEEDAIKVSELMKKCMENTCQLPGIKLIADPVIGHNLAEIKGE